MNFLRSPLLHALARVFLAVCLAAALVTTLPASTAAADADEPADPDVIHAADAAAAGTAGLDTTAAAASTWAATGSMQTPRFRHTATLLFNGKVLVAGGFSDKDRSTPLSSAELYDPATETWAPTTGSMKKARAGHTATLLADGTVLVVGGSGQGGSMVDAELYDPATGTWTATGSLSMQRSWHTATLLPNGKVLVTGGWTDLGSLETAEIYNPVTRKWSSAGQMSNKRQKHTATLLQDGKVLVAGGDDYNKALDTAEIYDPISNFWSSTEPMQGARTAHTATLLNTGQVLVAGGTRGIVPTPTPETELYDPVLKQWTLLPNKLTYARDYHAATLLPSGKVLVSGGRGMNGTEIFDPTAKTWVTSAAMPVGISEHTTTLLPGGRVLAAGGQDGTGTPRNTAALFNCAEARWTAAAALGTGRAYPVYTTLADGRVLVAGGRTIINQKQVDLNTAEIYTPADGKWTPTQDLTYSRYYARATLLIDGRVLVSGGRAQSTSLPNQRIAELFDPGTGTWTITGTMSTIRYYHTATRLKDGKVLVVGGVNTSALATAELYNPDDGTWTPTGSLANARYFHTATLLPDGKVLVAGGYTGTSNSEMTSAELYDPATGEWTPTGSLITARYYHTATLLLNGKVLVAGGRNAAGGVKDAELYDPETGTWASAGTMPTNHVEHRAVLLPSGLVLLAGDQLTSTAGNRATLYNPTTGDWLAQANMSASRFGHVLTLLPGGKVLAASGQGGNQPLASAEIYSVGMWNTWQPAITGIAGNGRLGGPLNITGTNLRGLKGGEGAGGGNNSSPSNYPLAQIRCIASGETRWLSLDPTVKFSGTAAGYQIPLEIPAGPAQVTVYVSGIPSTAVTINVMDMSNHIYLPVLKR